MRTRFLHAADIHLGYEQYNSPVRANDFARAWMSVVEYACRHEMAFVLVAGDLFHKSSADAWMMKQATTGLRQLRDVGIPVIAVEGNHDAQHSRSQLSWMEYLGGEDLLYLLNVRYDESKRPRLSPWNAETGGAWIDIAGTRIYGMKYYGAGTAAVLEAVHDQLRVGPSDYTIMMLHAGIQGLVPHMHGGLTPAEIRNLHPPVDYLALGHVHKRLLNQVGLEWVFNPGSTETNSMEEAAWPHGFFDVEVDTDASPKQTVHAVETPTLRPFRRISLQTGSAATVDEFVAFVEKRLESERSMPDGAVIELEFGGSAPFRRQDVPVDRLAAIAQQRFKPLVVRIRNAIAAPGVVSVRHGDRLRRSDLERDIVGQLVYQRGEYRDCADAWTNLILDVKNMAIDHNTPAAISDHVRGLLSNLAADPVNAPEPARVDAADAEDVLGGEMPCMAPLFEGW